MAKTKRARTARAEPKVSLALEEQNETIRSISGRLNQKVQKFQQKLLEVNPEPVRARREYLRVTNEKYPDVLDSLKEGLQVGSKLFKLGVETDYEIVIQQATMFAPELFPFLEQWTIRWGLNDSQDDWLLRVAMFTLFGWAQSGTEKQWLYDTTAIVPELSLEWARDQKNRQMPAPLRIGYHPNESQANFLERVTLLAKSYYEASDRVYGDKEVKSQKRNLEHYSWLACRQCENLTYDKIAAKFGHGSNLDASTVEYGVTMTARLVGVKVRKMRKGRHKKA